MMRAVTVPSQLFAAQRNVRTERNIQEEVRQSVYSFNKHPATMRRGY